MQEPEHDGANVPLWSTFVGACRCQGRARTAAADPEGVNVSGLKLATPANSCQTQVSSTVIAALALDLALVVRDVHLAFGEERLLAGRIGHFGRARGLSTHTLGRVVAGLYDLGDLPPVEYTSLLMVLSGYVETSR